MPAVASDAAGFTSVAIPEGEPIDLDPRTLPRRWVQLIRRIDEVDPLVCPRCAGPMRIITFITEPPVIKKILRHLAANDIHARSPPGPRERHPTPAWRLGVLHYADPGAVRPQTFQGP